MMQTLFTLWALAGIITALIIPQPNLKPLNHHHHHQPRGASLPTLENYTATYLRNNAIQVPAQCASSFISHSSFPATPSVNATQCRVDCERISAARAATGDTLKCRYFNVYMLFRNDENLGMQCDMYDRKWDNKFATNGGGNVSVWVDAGLVAEDGDVLEVSDSFAYWATNDLGDMTCGSDGVGGSVGSSATLLRTSPVSTLPLVISTPAATSALRLTTAKATSTSRPPLTMTTKSVFRSSAKPTTLRRITTTYSNTVRNSVTRTTSSVMKASDSSKTNHQPECPS